MGGDSVGSRFQLGCCIPFFLVFFFFDVKIIYVHMPGVSCATLESLIIYRARRGWAGPCSVFCRALPGLGLNF